MTEPFVSLSFAGCGADDESRALVRQQLHDQLIDAHPVRLGPVEWRHYDPTAAVGMLTDAGLADEPNAIGLVEWLAANPGTELVVATVSIPDPSSAAANCDCPECHCRNETEPGRPQCRLCRRGYHRPGARKPL